MATDIKALGDQIVGLTLLEAKALQGIDGGTLHEKAVGLFGARRPRSVKIASQVRAHDRVFQDALPE